MNKCRCPFHNCQNEVRDSLTDSILSKRESVDQALGGKPRDKMMNISIQMQICLDCIRQYQQNHH